MNHRTAIITGLRDLAAFLEANPGVPVPPHWITINTFPIVACDEQMRAHVDTVAALLGSDIDSDDVPHGHYSTARRFGPIEYSFTAILSAARARHAADGSYRGCIDPE
jgi:hypothetical protein